MYYESKRKSFPLPLYQNHIEADPLDLFVFLDLLSFLQFEHSLHDFGIYCCVLAAVTYNIYYKGVKKQSSLPIGD